MKLYSSLLLLAVGSAGLLVGGCTKEVAQAAPPLAAQPVVVAPVVVQQPAAPAPAPTPVYVAPEPQPVYVEVREAPPAIIVEQRTARPTERHVWIDGNWRWDGHRYDWSVGAWQVPPREHVIYVQPQYEHVGTSYRYRPGRWDDDRHH